MTIICWLLGHRWKEVDFYKTGKAIIGWDFRRRHAEWATSEQCERCGQKRVNDGFYIPGDIFEGQ